MNQRVGPAIPPDSPVSRIAVGTAERIGFWGTVLLPVAYLPALYSLDGQTKLLAVAALVAVNVLCLLVGHRYRS
ncbi:hypothetical protein GRX03_15760 [Halovenus sp. WSH3]|uniref:Uncharacterized protein n=1 Tax=Halovenus carboxidivorans TaxID=2692199 RepID=A0A6B0T4R8_9EURY|nr:hypothetical protein [Halovenus carboxidivorans]MXR53054.1 hypothetical protein [Halovenus carboxidivorans]